MRRQSSAALAAAVMLVVAACSGGGSSSTATTEVVRFDAFASAVVPSAFDADLGLRPDTDAPSFMNYQPVDPFGVDDAVALFGDDAVCETPSGPCVVRPQAQAWIEKVSTASAGGVCEGLAVLSLDRYLVGEQPPTVDLVLDDELNNRVVRLFATQFLPTVHEAATQSRGAELAATVDRIETGVNGGEPVTMGIYSEEGGHTLLPFAVERVSADRVVVWVYDPNWPTQSRPLEIDLTTGSWRYSFSSPDPTTDTAAWFGGPGDLDVVGLGSRTAPFPEAFDGAGPGKNLLTVTADTKNWSLASSDTTVGPDSRPGDEGVIQVSRGAFGRTTVVAVVDDGSEVEFSSDGNSTLTVEKPGRTVGLDLTEGGEVGLQLAADRDRFTFRSGTGRFRVSSELGRFSGDFETDGELEISDDEESYSDDDTDASVNRSDGERRDFVIEDGETVETEPLTEDPSVRSGSPTDTDDPDSSTTTTTNPTTTDPTTTTTDADSATTTEAPATDDTVDQAGSTVATTTPAVTTTRPTAPPTTVVTTTTTTKPPRTTTTTRPPTTTTTRPPTTTTTQPPPPTTQPPPPPTTQPPKVEPMYINGSSTSPTVLYVYQTAVISHSRAGGAGRADLYISGKYAGATKTPGDNTGPMLEMTHIPTGEMLGQTFEYQFKVYRPNGEFLRSTPVILVTIASGSITDRSGFDAGVPGDTDGAGPLLGVIGVAIALAALTRRRTVAAVR